MEKVKTNNCSELKKKKKEFVNCCFAVFVQFLTKQPGIYIQTPQTQQHKQSCYYNSRTPVVAFSKYDLVLSLRRTPSPATLPLMVLCVFS